MKKGFLLLLLLVGISLACNFGKPLPPTPTPTLAPLMADVLQPTDPPPSLTPTITPTSTPLPTPTPLPGMRIHTGDQAIFNGDWDTAISAFQAALDSSSDPEIQSAALVGLGRVLYQTGDYPLALDHLRAVVENYPASPHRAEAFFFLGQTFSALARYSEAADAFLNYLLLRPGVIDAYIYERRGDALFNANDFGGALGDYQAALKSPRLEVNFTLEIKMARCYAFLGDYNTALVMYADIYNRSGSAAIKAEVNLLKGQTLAVMGQPDQAYLAYLDSVFNYPTQYNSYLALVELVNAGYPVDQLQRGIVDYYAGEYGVALAALDNYLSTPGVNPADPASAYYYKGLALRAADSSYEAIEMWNGVIEAYTSSSWWDDAWEQKAYTQWAYLDLYAEAQQTLTAFVASSPTHTRAAEFLFDAAIVAERNGELAQAVLFFDRVANEYPLSGYLYPVLFRGGIARYRQGDYRGAQESFLRAYANATQVSERAGALLWAGKTYQALGDANTAISTWQQAAALDPTGYYSERALDLAIGRLPFDPPRVFDLGIDKDAERAQAETWLKTAFNLSAEVDLSGAGDLSNDPRFQRGQEFWRLGLYAQASQEFDSLRLSLQQDAVRSYQLANTLAELGVYRIAILSARQVLDLLALDDAATLTAPAWFSHLRFGFYYRDLVIPAAQAYKLNPLLVWSVMRQESMFERSSFSTAGARGLLQIMPSTGEDIAKRMNWPAGYHVDDLLRPQVNINMGLYYLDAQRGYLGGDLYTALAAYNGGPGNAAAWQALAPNDPDLFLEVIRLEETRRYIKGIYEIFSIYRKLYERSP